jgi:hypothetical protein
MDLTLTQIVTKIDHIYTQIKKTNQCNTREINEKLSELLELEQHVRFVYMKASNISNICNNKLLINDKQQNSWYSDHIMLTTPHTYKDIAHNITIPTKQVNDISDVPNTQLYWVKNINQFAIRINGVLFRGNIGNIYNQSHIKKNKPTNQTIICCNANKCKYMLAGKLCQFYHDPSDLLILLKTSKISEETYNIYKSHTRNFMNTSWIYTDLQNASNNIMMRHFGSKNTLKHEFDLIKINNSNVNKTIINNYRHQTMHDILVVLGINQCGLIKDYPDLSSRNLFYDKTNSYSVLSEGYT